MFNLRKSTIALALILAMAFTESSTVSAFSYSDQELESEKMDMEITERSFISDDVPEDITDYAQYYFSTIEPIELLVLGFTESEIDNIYLAPAITAYEYTECDSKYYYFPILCNNNIIATMTVFKYEDKYSVQLGKSELAQSLNLLSSDSKKQYSLVISDEAMYLINSDNRIEMLENFYNFKNFDDDIAKKIFHPT